MDFKVSAVFVAKRTSVISAANKLKVTRKMIRQWKKNETALKEATGTKTRVVVVLQAEEGSCSLIPWTSVSRSRMTRRLKMDLLSPDGFSCWRHALFVQN